MRGLQSIIWLAFCLFMLTNAAEKKTVLSQLGPYPVTVTDHEIRTNRTDALASLPQKRRLMVTVYRPHLDIFACPPESQSYIPYCPDAVAQGLNDLLSGQDGVGTADYEMFQLVNCSLPLASLNGSNAAPIVLFSPGIQSSRYVHASVLRAVASSGYTVVAVDHTYDAVAVVFPDGQVVKSNLSNADINSQDFYVVDSYVGNVVQPVRQADLVSVLDALERRLIPGFDASSRRPLKAAIYGHSLGGSTAAGAVSNDSRLVGGLNMDGTFFGYVRNVTVRKPFYMMSEEFGDTFTWPSFYAGNLRGWKSWTVFNNTRHISFTDLPLLVDLLNKRTGPESNGTSLLTGSINSQRNLDIDWRYVVSFLDFVLKGEQPTLLERPSFMFPDVILKGHSGQ